MNRRLLLSVVIGTSAAFATAAPTPPATQPLAVQVDQLLKRLDSDNFAERQSAANEIDLLPTDALPLLEAAIRKAGPELRSTLTAPILRLRQTAAKDARYRSLVEFYRSQTTAEYDRAGDKDRAWDEPAHRLTEEASKYFAATVLHRYLSGAGVTDAAAAVRKSGTTDPLLRYLAMRFDRTPSLQPLIDLWPAMESSGYSAYRKASLAAYIVHVTADSRSPAHKDKPNASKYLAAAAAYWPAILKDEKFPTVVAITQLQQLMDDAHSAGVDRKEAFDTIDAQLARDLGEEDVIRLNLRGSYFYGLANDQRAAGAGDISWDAANRSLDQAEKILTRCYELYPDDAHAAVTMLSVQTMQSHGAPQFDQWFARAIKADPENIDAYQKKLDFLDPSSFGNNGDRLAFARQCLASGQFETRIPLMVVEAHRQNEDPVPWASLVPRPYYAQADVWSDLSSAYEGFLRRHPDAWDDRAAYAELAYQAGQWATAAEQYRLLSAAPDWAKRNTGRTRLVQLELPIRTGEHQPRPDMAAAAETRDREDAAAQRRHFVDAYEAFGRKSPRWDEPARAALTAAANLWVGDPACTYGENDTILTLGKSALEAGCDDPLVRYVYHWTVDNRVTPHKPSFKSSCGDDVLALQGSGYSEYVKAWAMLNWIGQRLFDEPAPDAATKADCLRKIDALLPLFESITREHQTRDEYIAARTNRLFRYVLKCDGDEAAYYQQLNDRLQKAGLEPFALKELRAYYLWNHIHHRSTADENMKAAAEAESYCEQLWQERPDRREPLRLMVQLASWQRDAEKAGFWLRQFQLADPLARQAGEIAINAFCGSHDREFEQLFHAAADTHAYRTQLPFLRVDYLVARASQTEPDKPPADLPDVDKISDEETWQEIAGVFEGYLAKYPADSDRRSEYASLACRAARWLVAAEQLRVLGDRVRPKAFLTAERLEACKKKIAGFETLTSQPATPKVDEP